MCDDFNYESFVERMKKEKKSEDVYEAIEREIRRVDGLCRFVKGAVEARKKGIPYREKLKQLSILVQKGNFPKNTQPD
jgi:hypothetical protein